MQHAERLVKRMLGLGAAPNASQLRPAGVARNLVDLLLQDASLEAEIVALYDEATSFCRRIATTRTRNSSTPCCRTSCITPVEIEQWLEALGVARAVHQGR
jgi:bacterioferritin